MSSYEYLYKVNLKSISNLKNKVCPVKKWAWSQNFAERIQLFICTGTPLSHFLDLPLGPVHIAHIAHAWDMGLGLVACPWNNYYIRSVGVDC